MPIMLLTLLGLFLYITYAYPATADLVRNSAILGIVGKAANVARNVQATAAAAVRPSQ
jgi:DUF917 family protein